MRKTQRYYKHFNFFFFYLFYIVEFKINTEYMNRDWIVVYIHKYILLDEKNFLQCTFHIRNSFLSFRNDLYFFPKNRCIIS